MGALISTVSSGGGGKSGDGDNRIADVNTKRMKQKHRSDLASTMPRRKVRCKKTNICILFAFGDEQSSVFCRIAAAQDIDRPCTSHFMAMGQHRANTLIRKEEEKCKNTCGKRKGEVH